MSLSDYKCFSSQKLTTPGGMNWRGTWGIPGVYQFGDVVEGPDGEGYVCIDLDGNIGSTPGTAPAVWQLLSSGTATATSLTAANGSGITVGEPTTNNFTVATNLVAGSGIGLTPSGINTSLTVANTGILGITSGTGISQSGAGNSPTINNTGVLTVAGSTTVSVGGTAQNPIISTTQAFTDLSPGAPTPIPTATLVGPGTANITIPLLGTPNIPTVQGAVYNLSGVFAVTATNTAGPYGIRLSCVNGAQTIVAEVGTNTAFVSGQWGSGQYLPFSVTFPATAASVLLSLGVLLSAGAGDSTTININRLYLTRIV
jgi:hypothetical protein